MDWARPSTCDISRRWKGPWGLKKSVEAVALGVFLVAAFSCLVIVYFVCTAEKLGLPYLTAYLDSVGADFQHGANFAASGSTIQPNDAKMLKGRFNPISLNVQLLQFEQFKARSIEYYRQATSSDIRRSLPKPEDFSKALYTMDTGQNDIHAGILWMTEEKVLTFIPRILDQFASAVKKLHQQGARAFWIHNTGPIGCLPILLINSPPKAGNADQYGCVKSYNDLAQEFNKQLKDKVSQLRMELQDALITHVDMYLAKYSLIGEAKKQGFANPLGCCCGHYGDYHVECGGKAIVNGSEVYGASCSNPLEYISWDCIHYTEAANKWIANHILDGSFSDPQIPITEACHSHSALKASRIVRSEEEPLGELDEFEAAILDGDVDGGGICVEAVLNELLDDGDSSRRPRPQRFVYPCPPYNLDSKPIRLLKCLCHLLFPMDSHCLSSALLALAVLFSASLVPYQLHAKTVCDIPAIFNFGDSNSDTGGLSAAFGQAPPPNGESYFRGPAGRYSDGRLVIDFIAQSLGLPYLSAYLDSVGSNFTHGANFATAGSTIRPQNTTLHQSGFSPFSLNVQFYQFNDFRRRSQILRSQVRAYVPDVLDQFKVIVSDIYDQGGRSFWIHNTAPVGCLPYVMDRLPITAGQVDKVGCAGPFNDVARYFNRKLKEALVQLRKGLPMAAITYVDVYAAKYALISQAKKHGFEHPLQACCGHGGKYNYNMHVGCGGKIKVNGKEFNSVTFMETHSVRLCHISSLVLAVTLLASLTSSSSTSCNFPAIFNFGDSNSDTGGLSAALGQAPPPNGETFFHAPAGRYCDGRLIVDFMAESLRLPYLSAYLDSVGSNFSHGANFATAGSTIRRQNTTVYQSGYSPISLDIQSAQYTDFHRRSQVYRRQGGLFQQVLPKEEDFSRALYTFDIGQNDLTAGYKLNMSIEQVKGYVPDLMAQLSNIIKNVYAQGGRSFWIHNTGPVGCLPYVMDRFPITAAQIDEFGCASPPNEVAQYFNARLKEAVIELRKDLPLATITYVDIYSVKYSLISQAKKLGNSLHLTNRMLLSFPAQCLVNWLHHQLSQALLSFTTFIRSKLRELNLQRYNGMTGFENPFLACCGHGGKFNYNRFKKCGSKKIVNGKEIIVTSCKDPSVRINWDGTHFTEAANKWIFDQIVDGSFSDPPVPLQLACHKLDH
ncbi:hypothetical protein RJ640_016054 [Escallonia rubra]|uniref:GDSL esterase/lipase n=1 Tax=Escallonia rubra TaxID=112253 RepID=A0AA88RIH5_9ASTE|nr:hypothetical protein RJ640_016054 [Escallonia rubra]